MPESDSIAVATLVSILLWPALRLSVLPASGFDWADSEYGPKTALLVVGSTVWYSSR